MQKLLNALAAGVLCVLSAQAFAIGECDKYKTSYDRTYCYSRLFMESDKELNEVYKDLRDTLRDSVRRQLTETQRAWMKHRDQVCQPESGTINVDCNYDLNRKRSDYLRDRLRECRAGTCREELIAAPSWQ